jgi:hypothetical protein
MIAVGRAINYVPSIGNLNNKTGKICLENITTFINREGKSVGLKQAGNRNTSIFTKGQTR